MSINEKIGKAIKYLGVPLLLTGLVLAQDKRAPPKCTPQNVELRGVVYSEGNSVYILGYDGEKVKNAWADTDIEKIRDLLDPNVGKDIMYMFNPDVWENVPTKYNDFPMKIGYNSIKIVDGKRINK